MRKKKLFIFPQMAIAVVIFGIAEIIVYISMFIFTDFFNNSLLGLILATIILVVLPVIIVIFTCVTLLAQISVDENGLTKYLFGKKFKFFSWDQIYEIRGIDKPFCWLNYPFEWIAFFYEPVINPKRKFNNKKYSVLIYSRKAVLNEVKKYKPSNL